MISDKLQKAINEQIVAEMWSANLYLSMSFYLQREGYDGCATWMKKQSQEELEHAYDMANYVIKRGGVAKVDKIDVVPQEWNGVLGVFENVYEHECQVSKLIENVVKVASEEKDMASQDMCANKWKKKLRRKVFWKKSVKPTRLLCCSLTIS